MKIRKQCWYTVSGMLMTAAAFAGVPVTMFTYTGPDGGNWNNMANWNALAVPDATDAEVFVNSAGSNVTVNVDLVADFLNLTVDAGDTVHINNAQRLWCHGGTINNAGTIEVGSTGGNTYLQPVGSVVMLTGGGTVEMSDQSANWIYRANAGGALVNVDNTVMGSGRFGWAGSPTPITNQASGTVIANGVNPLMVESGGSNAIVNQGEMLAESGGTLVINGGTLDNTGGLVEARDGSTVSLVSCTIIGGELSSVGTGVVEANGSTNTFDGTMSAITNNATVTINNGARIRGKGSLINNGTIRIDSAGGNTYLQPLDEVLSLTGGGTIELSDQSANWIYKVSSGGALVNVDNTIMGAGRFGWSGSPTPITNQADGTVIANGVNALMVESGGSNAIVNQGEMLAESGGTLVINGGTLDNTGGLVEARDGSTVSLVSCTIIGGELNSVGTGIVEANGSTNTFDGTMSAITNNATVTINNGARIRGNGSLINNGTIRIDSAGGNTYLQPLDEVLSLTGGGTIELSDQSANWIYKVSSGGALVNVDNTIMGAGLLGWAGSPTPITNQAGGTILANASVNPLVLDDVTNQGSIQVTGTGGASATSDLMNSGTVEIDADRTLAMNGNDLIQTGGTTTVNGTLSFTSFGTMDVQGGVLNGTGMINGFVDSLGGGAVSPGTSTGTLTIANQYAQLGTGELVIEIDGLADHDVLDVGGLANLGGRLTIVFGRSYTPMLGDEITFLTVGAIGGSFALVDECDGYYIDYSDTEVTLVVSPKSLAADFNCDGCVNQSDLGILLGAFNQNGNGDTDNDGDTDQSDLGVLLGSFNQGPNCN